MLCLKCYIRIQNLDISTTTKKSNFNVFVTIAFNRVICFQNQFIFEYISFKLPKTSCTPDCDWWEAEQTHMKNNKKKHLYTVDTVSGL